MTFDKTFFQLNLEIFLHQVWNTFPFLKGFQGLLLNFYYNISFLDLQNKGVILFIY